MIHPHVEVIRVRVDKDEDETCTGEQGHGKMPTTLLPDDGIEQRPQIGPTCLELHVLSFPFELRTERPNLWQCRSEPKDGV